MAHNKYLGRYVRGMKKVNKRRKKASNRREMLCVSAVVVVLLCVMFVQSDRQFQKNAAALERIESLNAEIERESARTEEIAQLEAYVKTSEYAGSRARQNLGLVGEDEIVFRAQK